MVQLPVDTRLKVEQAIEDGLITEKPRGYLGISGIGHSCPRALWYGFRLCSQQAITPRQKRLFGRGHREEPIIVADLMKAGMMHHSDQAECIAGHGHIKGHCDGMLENVPDAPKTTHLAEFKTANDKNFKALVKVQSIEKWKIVYAVQAWCYMYLFKLKRSLFVVVNKNDDSRYYERVPANNEKAKFYLQRGLDIISSEIPPAKIGNSTWFECKWCNHFDVCHMGVDVQKTCRSCHHCDIEDGGKWSCARYTIPLSFEQQLLGCLEHTLMEGLRG